MDKRNHVFHYQPLRPNNSKIAYIHSNTHTLRAYLLWLSAGLSLVRELVLDSNPDAAPSALSSLLIPCSGEGRGKSMPGQTDLSLRDWGWLALTLIPESHCTTVAAATSSGRGTTCKKLWKRVTDVDVDTDGSALSTSDSSLEFTPLQFFMNIQIVLYRCSFIRVVSSIMKVNKIEMYSIKFLSSRFKSLKILMTSTRPNSQWGQIWEHNDLRTNWPIPEANQEQQQDPYKIDKTEILCEQFWYNSVLLGSWLSNNKIFI